VTDVEDQDQAWESDVEAWHQQAGYNMQAPMLPQQQMHHMQMQQMPQQQAYSQPTGDVVMVGMHQPVEALARQAFFAAGGMGPVWVPVGWNVSAAPPMQQQLDGCLTDMPAAAGGIPVLNLPPNATLVPVAVVPAPHQQPCTGPWQGQVCCSPASSGLQQVVSETPQSTPTAQSVASWPSEAAAKAGKSKVTAKEADALVAQLRDSDVSRRRMAVEHISRMAWAMALTRHGCRVVQAAFDAADAQSRLVLSEAIKGHVMEALRSPHANHVLQKCVAMLPPDRVRFVSEELGGHVREAARHPFGCRVLERLLEHCPHAQTQGLASEILGDVLDLCRHPYGNYVVQHVLEHGSQEDRSVIARALTPEVRRLARHKIASNVVEKVLLYCGEEDRKQLKAAMVGSPEELASLEHSNYGSFVVKEMRRR